MAMVLGKQSKDHDALQAAVAALARAGITEALDLSFLGSGDLLPQETVAEVLSDCTVPGAEAALEEMFKIAREGMEGSMALRIQGFLPAQRAPPEPAVGQAWEGLSGSRAERRVRFAADPAPPQKRVRQTKIEDSLSAKLTDEMQKAIDACFLVLDNLGHASPRYEKVRHPRKGQEASVVKLQTNAFISNFSSPKGLNTARRRFQAYLLAMKGLNVDPVAPEEWTLAACIASMAQRGASSPRKMVQALSWAERAYELNLGLEAPLVQAQRSSWNLGEEAPTRRPARTPSVEMVRQMEDLLFNAESNMMRTPHPPRRPRKLARHHLQVRALRIHRFPRGRRLADRRLLQRVRVHGLVLRWHQGAGHAWLCLPVGHVIFIGVDVLEVMDTGIFLDVHMKGVCLKARVRLWSHQCHMAKLRPSLSEARGVQRLKEVGARRGGISPPKVGS